MRRAVPALYALVFLAEVLQWTIVPLAPRFADDFALSKLETGALLATASVMTVVVAIPAGIWADRVGARTLTLAAGALLAASAVAQALAADFWSLLGARALFGAAFATIWTAGLAWLARTVPPGRRAVALGVTTTTAGIGGMVGPAMAGLLAERFGLWAPFAVVAVAAGAVTAALLALDRGEGSAPASRPLGETLRLARRDPSVLGAVAVTVLGGLTSGVVNLLVPLQLDANGSSTGAIGVVYSVGALVFILASAAVARLGDRAARLRVGGAAALLLACALGLVLASPATPAVVAFLLVRAPLLAVLFTIAYPLAGAGARRAGIGEGAAIGLLNVVWGAATVAGPLAGGALAQTGGERLAYGALVACCLATAGWAALATRRSRTGPQEEAAAAPAV